MKLLFGLLALVALANAVPMPLSELVDVENEQSITLPMGWLNRGSPAADEEITLTIALRQSQPDLLEKKFWEVSNPSHPSYGQHLSVDDITALVAPSEKTLAQVRTWLSQHGVQSGSLTKNKDFLSVKCTVSQAEALLPGANFELFEHEEKKTTVVRSMSHYSLPADIAPLVDFVGNVHRFPSFFGAKVEKNLGVHLGVTPDVARKRYNLTKDDVGSNANNTQGTAQFLSQHFSELDLAEFWLEFGRFKHESKVTKVVGPNHIPSGVEASLDVEYLMSLGANIPTWFWSTGGETKGQEPFLEWMVAVGNTSTIPLIFSVSYGDDEDSLSPEYMRRVNTEFQKVGVRGTSLLFASGDSGAGCTDKNVFSPSFPASSPYITSVGGTMFKSALDENKGEITNYISGGGFSGVFSQPSYQTNAVESFLKSSKRLPPAKMFNATGRAYPDVAALSSGFTVVVDLVPMPGVAGTSAATPTFSGIIGMLNDKRLTANKPPLGFLNPLIYQNPSMLYDVTEDCSAGCGDSNFCAQAGWDPCTGFGSPNYVDMATVVAALP
mmetsp:Transcript_33350/g.72050  ORF Transcript_33350/g.72050 Transcript_33350/m.72050 type:complete len:552 (-) Transcript_33350:59-1714(-)